MTSEHLLSANLATREYVFELRNAKNLSRENISVYSRAFISFQEWNTYMYSTSKPIVYVVKQQFWNYTKLNLHKNKYKR